MRHQWLLLSILQSAIASPASFVPKEAKKFEWTALGDSYASGVGSTTYKDGRRCLRYDQAYPVQMNDDKRLGNNKDHIFNNVVCSGSHSSEIEKYQFYDEDERNKPNWEYDPRPKFGNPRMATLSVGGDDIDFPGIIFNCILEAHFWGGPIYRPCDEQRKVSWDLLKSPNLVNNVDHLIKKAVAKGRKGTVGDQFKLYVTGYAEFFNQDDPGCDGVTFARAANPKDDGKDHIKMTKKIRKDFNDMSRALNAAIQAAVDRNKDKGVKFIDIQGNGALNGRRFCEPGIKEPDQHNKKLWFWHYPYTDPDNDNTKLLKETTDKAFRGFSTQQLRAKYKTAREYEDALYAALDFEKAKKINGGDPEAKGVWDTIGWRAKVFHPHVIFHQHIKDLVLAQYQKDVGGKVTLTKPTSPKPTCWHVGDACKCTDGSTPERDENGRCCLWNQPHNNDLCWP